MQPYKLEVYLKGGRLVATFTKDGNSPVHVLAEYSAGFKNNEWQLVQTNDCKEAVILRISEIEAMRVTDATGT